ncbi:transposase [Leptospira santarosai]|uniref:Insertion element IS402-like domain-containing protein n=1 Tax=Leptospira santarosai str. ZUN179 TaxID=1049985 RepID=M6V869_9LEPT|nr:transposase [Leptospira santarosai]EMO45708.1 hypothetical protein LEP1GSC187_1502 [Leptospira santarosai str. ZUN179]MDI7184868.1 transposase [Leptospira santarosai]MDI7201797.1 transposase [Leptospira santarosai]MDI7237477.1 transposase [Leptospira santarosai]
METEKVVARSILNGILWILQTSAQWKNLATNRYPSYQTCRRCFSRMEWNRNGTMRNISAV